MIKLFRNLDVCRSFTAMCVISLLTVGGAWYFDKRLLIPSAAVCALFIIVHILTLFWRYKRITALTADINKILHNEKNISINHYVEGELALLQSEIYKMTVRLREQQSKLLDDKVFLADLLADISHQIRTPLTSINILVSMLSKPDLTFEKREQIVHKLYGLLSRIDWLITALLKMSKLDAGTIKFHKEPIALNELLEKACMPVRVPIELRGQELEIEADGECICDVAWSCEAIGNIVKNCMEHTPDGGSIHISGQNNPLYTEIIITDDGSGIAAEDLPHIFERFYKGKESEDKGGFGIGLALARMIVTGQNGTLKAENAPSDGAMFTMRFYESTI